MSFVQSEQSILKLKVAHDHYEEVHTHYATAKAAAEKPEDKTRVATEFQPRFLQARKELSAAFNRGIAVSQTRRRLYGVLRLEPHLRRFLGDFDDEAALLDKPQMQESFEDYIEVQRKAHEAYLATALTTPKGSKGTGPQSPQSATKSKAFAAAATAAASASQTAKTKASKKRKREQQRAAAQRAKETADAAAHAAADGTVDGHSTPE